MKNSYLGEIGISILLIGVLIFFINPLDVLMPQMIHPFMAPFLVVLLILLVAFLWKERPVDERDQLHTFIATRFAYVAVVAALIFGVVYQSFSHEVDPFLVISLCVAFLAKIIGQIYGQMKH